MIVSLALHVQLYYYLESITVAAVRLSIHGPIEVVQLYEYSSCCSIVYCRHSALETLPTSSRYVAESS